MAEDHKNNEMWCVVHLMGHDVIAGVMRPCEIGGLMKVDIPIEDGFRTEFIGPSAVFRIQVVSEEIARVYARPERGIIALDTPIVPREMFEDALQKARNANEILQRQIRVLQGRLTAVNALPEQGSEDLDFGRGGEDL